MQSNLILYLLPSSNGAFSQPLANRQFQKKDGKTFYQEHDEVGYKKGTCKPKQTLSIVIHMIKTGSSY